MLLAMPNVSQAQFTFTTNNGAITITGYTGLSGAVVVPDTTNGYPVTSIGDYAFAGTPFLTSHLTGIIIGTNVTSIGANAFMDCRGLTAVTIPDNVTTIGANAFLGCINLNKVLLSSNVTNMGSEVFGFCSSLSDVKIPHGVTTLGDATFYSCTSLASLVLPSSVTNIGANVFYFCTSLTDVLIPNSVTSIEGSAFGDCFSLTNLMIPNSVTNIASDAFNFNSTNLANIYFLGNAPKMDKPSLFYYTNLTIFYLPDATGWSNSLAGIPAFLWLPQIQAITASSGLQTNQFGFNIQWASGQSVVVEACTNILDWQPVETNTLTTGTSYFNDPQWTNYPSRFYRIRSL